MPILLLPVYSLTDNFVLFKKNMCYFRETDYFLVVCFSNSAMPSLIRNILSSSLSAVMTSIEFTISLTCENGTSLHYSPFENSLCSK